MSTSLESLLNDGRVTRGGFLRALGGATVLSMPGVLAACGTSSGGGNGTLRMIGVADQRPPLQALAAAYAKQHSDTKFKTSYAPTDQVQTSVRAQLGAGNPPDIHVVYPGSGSAMSMAEIVKAGLLTDLSDQSWTKLIPKSLAPAYKIDGKTYIYSAGSTAIGAIYNKKAFAKAGIDAPPTNWDELLEVCAKLKKAGIAPIALGAQTPWVTQLITYALVPSTVYAKDPTFDEKQQAGQASFADSGWRQAMEMYLELQKRGFFNPNPNGTTFEQQTSMVGTGKAGMAVQVSAVLSGFRDAASSPSDVGMFPFPGGQTAEETWIPAGAVVGLGVSAKAKEPEKAKAFIEYLGQQGSIDRWSQLVAAIPMHEGANSKIDPDLKSFLPFVKANKAVPFMDQRWPNAEVQPVHFEVVQELLGGKTSIDSALKKMDDAYAKKA